MGSLLVRGTNEILQIKRMICMVTKIFGSSTMFFGDIYQKTLLFYCMIYIFCGRITLQSIIFSGGFYETGHDSDFRSGQ